MVDLDPGPVTALGDAGLATLATIETCRPGGGPRLATRDAGAGHGYTTLREHPTINLFQPAHGWDITTKQGA